MSRPSTSSSRRRRAGRLLAVLAAALLLTSCSPAPNGSRGSSLRVSAIDRRLLVVRSPAGGHFVARSTGAPFVLRGFDYQPLMKVPGSVNHYLNETFLPSYYRHGAIVSMVERWQVDGYNAVRVFLDPSQIGNPDGTGLSAGYVANLADFVTTAARHDVRTLVTVGSLPTRGGYAPPVSPNFGPYNEDYLDAAFIAAEKAYLTDLVAGLRARRAPLVDVLWELKGEQDWNDASAPLDWRSGSVATADGKRYEMASAASRVAMETDNLLFWTNALTDTLHRLVPGSLVGVGVFPPYVKHRTWSVTPGVLFGAAARNDFVDVHVYPIHGPELVQMRSFDVADTEKPVIMGEFGASRTATVSAATANLVTWQQRSCHIPGLTISGWLLWSWNSSADGEFWDALAHGAEIARALAPVNRPDPCG